MASVINTVKNADRLRQITTVLVKHGFGELLARAGLGGSDKPDDDGAKRRVSFAERLRLALQELGPSFIKLGQIASTRPDLIPPDVIVELKKLQDDVPPISLEDVHATIAETLGAPADQIYASFVEKPLACASIGQVHRARLLVEGAEVEVVIKVQRPRIRDTIERDLDLLYFMARVLERAVPESRTYSPVGMVAEFDRAIMAELDFGNEADNAEKFTKNFTGSTIARFPKVYRQASGKRVLTIEFFDGKKINAAIAAGTASGEQIAKRSLAVIAQMIFEDGFFHADPHPGNVLILPSDAGPVLGLLDLGLVGRLPPDMRDKAIDLMLAAVRNEVDALADALLAIGRPRGKVNMPAFRAEVARVSEKYLGKSLKEVEMSGLIRDLIQGAVKFEIDMPTELLMVGKALMTVEGVGKEIYPELDVFTEFRPYFIKLLWKRYSPERIGREALRLGGQLRTTLTRLPKQLHTILEDLQHGRLEIKTSDAMLPAATDRLGRRVYAAVVVGSLTVTGGLLLANGRHEQVGIGLLVGAGVQLVAHLLGDLRRKLKRI